MTCCGSSSASSTWKNCAWKPEVDDCTFCGIVAGRRPASVVYQDEVVMACLDIRPRNPGHTLVVPRVHAASLAELPELTGAHMFVVAMRVAGALRSSGVRCEAISLGLADGAAAGQEVPHCHLHVRPRFAGDGRERPLRPPSRAELDAIAAVVRAGVVPAD
jgi:diadenosine tetraphosphate (Ap4A) HIT family hydrolase